MKKLLKLLSSLMGKKSAEPSLAPSSDEKANVNQVLDMFPGTLDEIAKQNNLESPEKVRDIFNAVIEMYMACTGTNMNASFYAIYAFTSLMYGTLKENQKDDLAEAFHNQVIFSSLQAMKAVYPDKKGVIDEFMQQFTAEEEIH